MQLSDENAKICLHSPCGRFPCLADCFHNSSNVTYLNRFLFIALHSFAWICVTIFFAWAIGAIWFFDLLPNPMGPIAGMVTLIGFVILFFRLKQKQMWMTWAGLAIFVVWMLSLLQQPTHDREWAADQTVLSQVVIDGDDVTIKEYRHNVYRSDADFDVYRSDYSFKLSELNKVWFIVQRFAPQEGLAHVFLSFEVSPADGESKHFSLSVEIRREEDEYFSPTQGLYRQYELNYVFGDERDLIGVRTVMRPEDRLFMHPVNATPEQVQQAFRSIADRTNQIYDRPEFYHTVLNNCMNGILRHTVELTPEEISWFDPRIIMPGYSDRFAFQEGIIGSADQSFELLRESCRIDLRAREHGIRDGFSNAIREEGN